MKETVYIRKKSQVFQAYDVNLHVVYRNSKAITEYDYVLDLQTIEQHDEDVRKETAKEILRMIKDKGLFRYGGYLLHDSDFDTISKLYGVGGEI